MRFTDSKTDSADVLVRAIHVQLSNREHPLLTVRYELASTEAIDPRPLLVEFSSCPLWPVSLEGSEVNAIQFDGEDGTTLERVFLRPRANATWNATSEVTMTLEWTSRAPHDPLLGQSYLYLPAELPQIGKRQGFSAELSRQPPVRIQGEFQSWLVGAQSYALDALVNGDDPLLRGVLSKKPSIRFDDERDRIQACLIGDVTRSMSAASRQHVRSTIGQMCNYFSEKLHAPSSLRIAAALDSGVNARSVSGPLLAQSVDRFRLPELNQSGHEFPIAREIAANWWGAGVRVEGPGGVYLTGGIAFALGLLWTQSHAPRNFFDALLQYYTERMVDSARYEHVRFRPGERSAGIGTIVYEALASNPKLWTVLQQLTPNVGAVTCQRMSLSRVSGRAAFR
jgi:hypothetical protein